MTYVSSVSKPKVVFLRPGTFSHSRSKRRRSKQPTAPTSSEALTRHHPGPSEELLKYWTVKAVPMEQQSAFLAVVEGLAEEQKSAAIAAELELVRKDKSCPQLVDRTIQERESAIRSLWQLIQSLPSTFSQSHSDFLVSALSRLRLLSIQTVERVQEWRERLFTLNPANPRILKLPYMWEGRNYLLKLRADLGFLRDSQASRYMAFSQRLDPFLLFPSHWYRLNKATERRKVDLPVEASVLRDVRKCESILLEEVLNGREVEKTFRRDVSAERRKSETRQGLEYSENRSQELPNSEELLRPITRGKEKQLFRGR